MADYCCICGEKINPGEPTGSVIVEDEHRILRRWPTHDGCSIEIVEPATAQTNATAPRTDPE